MIVSYSIKFVPDAESIPSLIVSSGNSLWKNGNGWENHRVVTQTDESIPCVC